MGLNELKRIEHIVVLMLENRSFDNLLGWLYDPSNPAPFNQLPPANFEGLSGKSHSNVSYDGRTVLVQKGTNLTAPYPDPGEPYEDIYAQIYAVKQKLTLATVPAEPGEPASMGGFLLNYYWKNQGNPSNADHVMDCFTPASVPVLSSLAYHYGVCDHWFASIPSQTLCNRSFMQAGTSSGYVNNEGGDGVLFTNDTPTIFNVLEEARRSWRVYSAGWTMTSLVLLTQLQVWDFALQSGYFEHIKDFFAAAGTSGGLPAYSFIEPNYIDSIVHGPENDMHPESHQFQLFGRSNVAQGEKLVYEIYSAIRNSPDWGKILFLILFDEHGGSYDHVPPPTQKDKAFIQSPDGIVISQTQPGGSGFAFDRLGVRIPAIVVSPYTPAGTIVNTIFDHTSALKTVVKCFDLPADKLKDRQEAAPDISEALQPIDPRTDYPPIPEPAARDVTVTQRAEALGAAMVHAQNKPMSDLQKKILVGAARRLKLSEAEQQQIASSPTAIEADAELLKLEAQLAAEREMRRLSRI